MPVFNNALAGAAGSAGGADAYQIERSLRFNRSDSAHLSKNFGTSGNRKTWTYSTWVKRSKLGAEQMFGIERQNINNAGYEYMRFDSNDRIDLYLTHNGSNWSGKLQTEARFRDVGAWLHVVLVCDITNSTAGDRIRLYVNGERITTFNSSSYPATTEQTTINHTGNHHIGKITSNSQYYGGYLAETHFLDGIAVSDPDGVFGEFDATTGVWNPIKYSGSYGTNGFHLDYAPTGGQVFSSGTLTGGMNASNPITRLFDGSTSTGTWGVPTGFELTFPSPVTVASSITFVGGSTQTNFKAVVDGTEHSFTWPNGSSSYTQEVTINVSGSFTGIKSNNNYGEIRGIRVDGGPLLIDHEAPGVDASGKRNHWTPNNFSLATTSVTHWRQATGGDNPSSGSIGSINYRSQRAITNPQTSALIWDHQNTSVIGLQNITGITSLRLLISSRGGAKLGINTGNMFSFGNHGGDYGNAQANAAWYTVSNPPSTLTSIAGHGGGSGTGNFMSVWGIEVNGERVVDTSGADCDSLLDSPTNYEADSGNNGGNYCTFNPVSGDLSGGGVTMSNGNLEITRSGGSNRYYDSTMTFSSDKWYWEMTVGSTISSYPRVGIWNRSGTENFSGYPGQQSNSSGRGWGAVGIAFGAGGDISSGLPTFTANDTLMFAMDLDNGKIWFGKNGTWYSTGTSTVTASAIAANTATARFDDLLTESTGTSWTPIVHMNSGDKWIFNPGSRPFAYTPPTGFKSLCTQNLDDPLIENPSTAFQTKLWTGNQSARSITTTGMSPDLVWIKSRSHSTWHELFDSIRGPLKQLYSNETNTETNTAGTLTAFNTDGFSLGTNNGVNGANTRTYVGWCWDGGNLATNSTYDQSEVWSSFWSATGNGIEASNPAANSFDGVLTGLGMRLNASSSCTWAPTGGYSYSGDFLIYACKDNDYTGVSWTVVHAGGTTNITSSVAAGTTMTELNLTNLGVQSPITSISFTSNNNSNPRIAGMKANGKLLVDAGVVPIGSLNSTIYNTSQNWSVAGSNMQNNWAASFDGKLSPTFALPNTGNSASMTFPSAISYQTLELVVSRDIFAPDLLMNGNTLNVAKTDTNTTGGRYKIERLYFTDGTLTSIGHETRNTAGRGGSGFWQIIVDGKILVDTNQASNAPNVPSIATTCTSNPTAGFAISTYKGNSTSGASISHNLGSTPEMVIVKARNKVDDWRVYHVGAGNPYYLRLQLGNAGRSGSGNWQEMSLNYFALDADSAVNSSSYNYVAYSFSSVPGYSLIGSYTGSGSQQFINLGFKPAWVMIKRYTDNTVGEWGIYDSVRAPHNEIQKKIWANNSSGEEDHPNNSIDFVSNGFVIDPGGDAPNVQYTNNGSVGYLYAAFAENPFKYARAR